MRILVLLSVGFIAFACQKSTEKLEKGDYLIFGHFYGFCGGEECVETYILSGSELAENTSDNYGSLEGATYVNLSDELYAAVAELETSIPSELSALPDSTFGCPDCHDQGGVRVSLKKDDVIKTWRMDNDLDAIPAYLHDFVNLIHAKIELINS